VLIDRFIDSMFEKMIKTFVSMCKSRGAGEVLSMHALRIIKMTEENALHEKKLSR